MRPDIEDFEELEQVEGEGTRGRAMSWLVLGVAVVGFGALAYYAYNSGTEMQNGDVMVVEADSTPIKEVPADPEGEQFANQDKTIYDAISPNASENASVEQLLPEPEKPVAAPQEVADAAAPTTYVNKNLKAVEEQPAAEQKPAPMVVPVPSSVVSQPVEPVAKAAAPVEKLAVAAQEERGAPTFVNESPVAEVKAAVKKPAAPVVAKKEEAKAAPKKEAAKPAEKKAEKPAAAPAVAAGGSYQIQLGAFKSEADAEAHWKKLSGKYASVLSGAPVIVKAELDNGTFYRLRTGGFASADAAKAACGKLGGAACFPVK